MRRLLSVLCLAPLTACYTYSHVETGAARSPEVIRVELSDQGTVDLTQAFGTGVQYLEGPVSQNSSSGLVMQVSSLKRRGETLFKEWTGDSFTLPAGSIRELSVKTMDRRRTTAAVVGASVTGLGIIFLVARATNIFSGGPGKNIPVNIR